MSKYVRVALAVCLLVSVQASAAVFVVPDDRELTDKSTGIVIGVVEGDVATARPDGHIDTIYTVRVERVLKGDVARDSVIEVASPGGHVDRRWLAVPGSAHFVKGDKVLLFLNKHRGDWTPTDMTLGKFRFVTSTGGQSLLVRDEEDIVGFDKQMRTHVERVRREADFLKFIEESVRGRQAESNYFLSPQEAVSLKEADKDSFAVTPNAFTAQSYAIHFGTIPGRWADVPGVFNVPARMTASLANPFFQSNQQSATGLGDGGVAMLQSSLNGWINDCGSYVNVPYGGTNSLLKSTTDGINTVVWNDPGAHLAGSWTGSGVIATCFIAGGDRHTFDGRVATQADGSSGWVSLSDADVVVQNGLTGSESFVDTAMMHEIGHGIGLRHSNTHHDGSTCQGTDECTGNAIMNSTITATVESYVFTAQPWDINAIRLLYPTSCGSAPAPPTNMGIFSSTASTVSLSWSASDGATSYRVYRRSGPGAYTLLANVPVGTSHIDTTASSGTAYQYVVRAVNASGESGDSNSDFTTAIGFTDAMGLGLTVKLVHFTELQTAVNALRTLAGLPSFSFAAPAPATNVTVRKSHVDGLRTALNEARNALGASSVTFNESLVAASTTVKAVHMTELRNGVF